MFALYFQPSERDARTLELWESYFEHHLKPDSFEPDLALKLRAVDDFRFPSGEGLVFFRMQPVRIGPEQHP